MHPLFHSIKNLLAVSAMWMALSLLIGYFLYQQLVADLSEVFILLFPLLFFYFFFCLSNYYICSHMLIRRTNLLRLLTTQLIAMISTVAIWLLVGFVYVLILSRDAATDWLALYWDAFTQLAIVGAILYCFWVLSHYIYLMARHHDVAKRADLQQRLLISQTELQAVKATVHPHFLFNSLNMIANLALVEPKKVHSICLQISEFLRYSVSYSRKTTATVGEELDHVQNYLGIERERFGPRLKTVFEVDEDVRAEPMLPLLLFPLVENSIKHGIDSSLAGGTLTIKVDKVDDVLIVRIENPYDELGKKQSGANIGLESVKKRVHAHYHGLGKVQISRASGKFIVELILPLIRSLHEP